MNRVSPIDTKCRLGGSLALPQHESVLGRATLLRSLLLLLIVTGSPNLTQAESDSARVSRLFMWASDGNIRHRDLVDPAKDSLGQMGEKAAPWLAKRLSTSDARERLTLADIFEKIGKPATPFLIPYLDSAGDDYPRNAARALERIKDTAAVLPLLRQLEHETYSVCSQVATALGKTRDKRALAPLIQSLVFEDDSDVRKSAAVALGDLGDARASLALFGALADSSYAVRQAAILSFSRIAPAPFDLFIPRAGSSQALTSEIIQNRRLVFQPTDSLYLELYPDFITAKDVSPQKWPHPRSGEYLVAMGACGGDQVRFTLTQLLSNTSPQVRGFAVEALSVKEHMRSSKEVAKLKKRETDPFVLAQIARFEQIVLEKKNAESKPQ